MLDLLVLALGMAGLALAMLALAWFALGEYRKLFLANPKLVMSIEVFSVAAEVGGPGYLAAVLGFFGFWLLMGATLIAMVLVYGFFA